MNNQRRRVISKEALRVSKVLEALCDIQASIQEVQDDEQFAYDNTPENLQYTDRFIESEEALEHLEDAISSLEEAIESLENIA